ncbi:hypothetical protein VNI00_015037 [Paramarasmius palmivorus]|uniref:Uncharacterized protein n=1 Tax=Paramarasmius palmivorus TaxID=297713 RepID=A0AAW0BPE5_9AGAR
MAYLPAQQNDEADHQYALRSLSSIRYRTKKEYDLYKKGSAPGHYHRLQVYVDQQKLERDRFGEQSIVCLSNPRCSLRKKEIGKDERDLLLLLDPLYLGYQSAKKSLNTAMDRLNGDKKGEPSTVAKNPGMYWKCKDSYLEAQKKFYDAYNESQDSLAALFLQTNGYSITKHDINIRNEALERLVVKLLRVPEPVRPIVGRKRRAPDIRDEAEDTQAIPPKTRKIVTKFHSPQPYPGPRHEPLTPPPTSDFDVPVTGDGCTGIEEGDEDNETLASPQSRLHEYDRDPCDAACEAAGARGKTEDKAEESVAGSDDGEVVITGEGKAVEVEIDVGDGESITIVGEPRRRRKGKAKVRSFGN